MGAAGDKSKGTRGSGKWSYEETIVKRASFIYKLCIHIDVFWAVIHVLATMFPEGSRRPGKGEWKKDTSIDMLSRVVQAVRLVIWHRCSDLRVDFLNT
jgi:hypothetical protein